MIGTGVRFRAAPRAGLLDAAHGEHVWVAIAAYRVQPETLRGSEGDEIHLDMENLASVDVGCYVCEQPWAERLSYRKCPGEPGPAGHSECPTESVCRSRGCRGWCTPEGGPPGSASHSG
jgi:hypothetical protein